jgi:hypothetical protein
MTRIFLAATVLAVVAAGCGIGSSAVDYSDPRSDAAGKTFAVSPGKGSIYLYRNQVYMSETPLEVVLDERWVGKTVGLTYFAVEVDTGKHMLRAKGDTPTTLDVFVSPGQNVFVLLQVSPSVMSIRGSLQVKDETSGQAGVRECRRIEVFE